VVAQFERYRMNRFLPAIFLSAMLLMLPNFARAGTNCSEHTASAREFAEASESARRVYAALEQSDAPVALLARSGTDLGKYGLHYSHVAFVVRDHPDGRWTVVHLLNRCGTDHSSLYAQGLVNFFLDDLVNQDARIVWLQPPVAARLAALLKSPQLFALHNPHYNVIARFDSPRTQNSTAWVLDVLDAARLPESASITRANAQALEHMDGFRPDVIHIPYGKRILGGLFSANTDFTDHPVTTRLSGDYPVVTVRSIFRYLEQHDLETATREWHGAAELSQPGPA
jgi:hypothetical protein